MAYRVQLRVSVDGDKGGVTTDLRNALVGAGLVKLPETGSYRGDQLTPQHLKTVLFQLGDLASGKQNADGSSVGLDHLWIYVGPTD
jgi:hypothetical protein